MKGLVKIKANLVKLKIKLQILYLILNGQQKEKMIYFLSR